MLINLDKIRTSATFYWNNFIFISKLGFCAFDIHTYAMMMPYIINKENAHQQAKKLTKIERTQSISSNEMTRIRSYFDHLEILPVSHMNFNLIELLKFQKIIHNLSSLKWRSLKWELLQYRSKKCMHCHSQYSKFSDNMIKRMPDWSKMLRKMATIGMTIIWGFWNFWTHHI